MFIHFTKIWDSEAGSYCETHQLCGEFIEGYKVRDRPMLNLGPHFEVEPSLWEALCTRIEAILRPDTDWGSDTLSPKVEEVAQRIAAKLSAPRPRKREEYVTRFGVRHIVYDAQSGYHVSVGVESVGLWALKELEFDTLLEYLCPSQYQLNAIIALIVGRMVQRGNEREMHDWLCGPNSLGEFLDWNFEEQSAAQLRQASNALRNHHVKLEERLFVNAMDFLDRRPTAETTPVVTLYDLTKTYLGGLGLQTGVRTKTGYRLQSEPYTRFLLTVGLVLDVGGVIHKVRIFRGNVSAVGTLPQMPESFRVPKGAVIVMGPGVATEGRIRWLKTNGYRYVAVSKVQNRVFTEDATEKIITASGERLVLHREEQDDEVRLHVRPQSGQVQDAVVVERQLEKFEAALGKIADGLANSRVRKHPQKIWERIGRLREQYGGVGTYYDIDIKTDGGGTRTESISWQCARAPGSINIYAGVYNLRTNVMVWDNRKLLRTYAQITDVKAVLRCSTSELNSQPSSYNRTRWRHGELLINAIAYQLVQLIRIRLRAHGIRSSWNTLRHRLNHHNRRTITFLCKDGRILYRRRNLFPAGEQRQIYRALGIHYEMLPMVEKIF